MFMPIGLKGLMAMKDAYCKTSITSNGLHNFLWMVANKPKDS